MKNTPLKTQKRTANTTITKAKFTRYKPIRAVNNWANNMVDSFLWANAQKKNPQVRESQLNVIAHLNPSLARRQNFTPTVSRASYNDIKRKSGYDAFASYNQKRKNVKQKASNASLALAALGVSSSAYIQQKQKQQEKHFFDKLLENALKPKGTCVSTNRNACDKKKNPTNRFIPKASPQNSIYLTD